MIEPGDAKVELKVVGRSGQVSLGKRLAGKTLRLERRRDGSLVLTPVALVPEKHLWTTHEPHRSRIEKGLAWAAETEAAETDLGALARRASARRPEARRRVTRGRR